MGSGTLAGKIIVVDDSAIVRESVQAYLAHAGYGVRAAGDGGELRRLIAEEPADLVILDLRMPGDDGLTLTQFLRARARCGIVMLTANADPMQRIVALESGADDYLCKPHEPRELLARVRSVLRRVMPAARQTDAAEAAPPWRLDEGARSILSRDGRSLRLTNAEFKLLDILTRRPGETFSRDILLRSVYGRDWTYFDRSIDVLVTRLRRKLETVAPGSDPIRSVRGAGYLFCQAA